ncbi:hypothetical protein [Gemmobacter lutimaris]|uniref:hypothetical protein n=1 Tax=Gemmobacter lutimaris TaxID=2306023 RepID=UPI0013146031|nr:hypothetical protein [Gemmobacter lutimaris]
MTLSVKLIIGANAYACVTHDAGQTDIRLSPGKSAVASLREYATECEARAAREKDKAELARRAADHLERDAGPGLARRGAPV